MIDSDFIAILLPALLSVICFVELFLLLPFNSSVRRILTNSQKSARIMKSSRISDHWKQKAILRYSRDMMAATLSLIGCLIVLFSAFLSIYYLTGFVFADSFAEITAALFQTKTQIIILVLGVSYAALRKKTFKPASEKTDDYSRSSKLFHQLVLGNGIVKEMAFDFDCVFTRKIRTSTSVTLPVYITGLARSGTTILLEALYSTGRFTTLTYRDMPLITAPYMWKKVTAKAGYKHKRKEQRAHGDAIFVDFDSPEAFEEVFWMTFADNKYIYDSYLSAHDVGEDQLNKYRAYVSNIVLRSDTNPKLRYLAKNNNNTLRISAIKEAFCDAIIIVPFRNPIDHAKSLLRQHMRFLQMHSEDLFALKYMNWLAHFEFGANFKPFNVNKDSLPSSKEEPETLEYWLRYWTGIYEFLLDYHAPDVLFVNHDSLCEHPEQTLARLESMLSLPTDSLAQYSKNIRFTRQNDDSGIQLKPNTLSVYQRLQSLAS